MRLLKVLKQKSVAMLWSGQVFSAVGDEVYNIALVWFAANLIGNDAGYISAIQAAAVFIFSLVGGIWVDHRDPRKVMIVSDVARGCVVLTLPAIAFFVPLNLWFLVPVAIIVSSLSAFFGPALMSIIPQLAENPSLLQSTNGLMETTNRFARIIGPGLVSLLSRHIPLVHYFTVDAASFFVSAWSIAKIDKKAGDFSAIDTGARGGVKATLMSGYHLVNRYGITAYTIYSGGIVGGAWLFIFPLGMTLLLREKMITDIGALGTLVFAYGVGNLSSNLILSNFYFARFDRLVFFGRILGGAGFILLVFSRDLHEMMASCALAATGGPMTDIGFNTLMQSFFRGRDISRVWRFGMAVSYGCLLVGLLATPMLFRLFSVPSVILASAIAIFGFGLLGLVIFWRPAPGTKSGSR